MNSRSPGRHFLQIPGPTDVPGRILRAISEPTIDHRGPGFADLGRSVLTGSEARFQNQRSGASSFPASGTGAWEAALVNTLSPGDEVLMVRTGWFATLWSEMATRLGLKPIIHRTDWRRGADPAAIEAALRADTAHNDQGGLRRAQRDLDRLRQSASRGPRARSTQPTPRAAAGRHDLLARLDRLSPRRLGRRRHRRRLAERPDAAAGPRFNAISAEGPRGVGNRQAAARYWDWRPMLEANATASTSPTPRPPTCCAACRKRSAMLEEEGLRQCLRPARSSRGGDARGGARLGRGRRVELQCQADPPTIPRR